MSTYFKPYEGRRPYVFISYSHRNSDRVLSVITPVHEKKLRLWYDEGIPAGGDWPQNIADHMAGCAAVLFFVSAPALASANCRSEIETAVRLHKPLLLIRLDDTVPSEPWQTLLAAGTTLSATPGAAPDDMVRVVLAESTLNRSFYRKRWEGFRWDRVGLALSLLLVLAAAAGLWGLLTGRFDRYLYREPFSTPTAAPTPTPTVPPSPSPTPYVPDAENRFPLSFPDALQDDAIRTALGIERDAPVLPSALKDLRSLCFCGGLYLADAEDAVFSDAGWSANGVPTGAGTVRDLSVIGRCTYLETLALIAEPADDLSGLSDLVLLQTLYLNGCESVDLASLPALPNLKTLHLAHSAVRDLAPLGALPALQTVTVSTDMLPLTWPTDAAFSVVLVP